MMGAAMSRRPQGRSAGQCSRARLAYRPAMHAPHERDYPTKIFTALESNQFTFESNYSSTSKFVRMD